MCECLRVQLVVVSWLVPDLFFPVAVWLNRAQTRWCHQTWLRDLFAQASRTAVSAAAVRAAIKEDTFTLLVHCLDVVVCGLVGSFPLSS